MTTATIHSRTGSQSYTVSLHDNGAASCTCKAGQYGRCCWHVNAVRAEAVVAPAYRLASMRTGKTLGMYATLIAATAAQVANRAAGGTGFVDAIGKAAF